MAAARIQVRIKREGILWCLYGVNLPRGYMTAEELAHPAADYLGGYLSEQSALDAVARSDWEVVT